MQSITMLLNSARETKSIKGKITRFWAGATVFQVTSKIGTLLINPFFLWIFEPEKAIIFMVIFSLIVRYFLVRLYDIQKIDWFFIEELKQYGEIKFKSANFFVRSSIYLLNLSKGQKKKTTAILLCWDPSLIVMWVREGFNTWNGFEGFKTKLLFLLSSIVCALISFIWEGVIIDFLKLLILKST